MYVFNWRMTVLSLSWVCAVSMASCTGWTYFDNPDWTQTQITDVKEVAGIWEGTTWMVPRSMREQNWGKVKIEEDGTYEFQTFRNIGAWKGKGTLKLENGKLVGPPSEEGGTLRLTLHTSGDKRMLKIESTNKEGRLQRGELTPAKKKGDGY